MAFKLILGYLENFESLVLPESHPDAFAAVRAEVIIVQAKVFKCLVPHKQRTYADSSLHAERVLADRAVDYAEVQVGQRCVADELRQACFKTLSADHVRGEVEGVDARILTEEGRYRRHATIRDLVVG